MKMLGDNGREGTSIFVARVLDQRNGRGFALKTHDTMVNHPPMDGRHSERPPRRDAIYFVSGLGGRVWCGAAVVGSSGAE